jgi:hypothetical protein
MMHSRYFLTRAYFHNPIDRSYTPGVGVISDGSRAGNVSGSKRCDATPVRRREKRIDAGRGRAAVLYLEFDRCFPPG